MNEDAKAALDLFAYLRRQGRKIAVSQKTHDELVRLGIDPTGAEVTTFQPGTVAVCPHYEVWKGLALPDNRIARCSECGAAIQHRPHVPAEAKLICTPCGLRMVRGDA